MPSTSEDAAQFLSLGTPEQQQYAAVLLLLAIVTLLHLRTRIWWRTIMKVEPTDEVAHYQERAQPQFWLITQPPPTLPPHTSASAPWPRGPAGRACTEGNDTMHPCYAHIHNEHELQHTPGYAGIPMPLLKMFTHALAQAYMMNSAHPGLGSEI
jgi:hypothetical protein